MAPPGLPFPLPLPLLLLVLLSEVPLAASGQVYEVKDGVGFELGPADHRISSVSFPASNNQEECHKGYFKDHDSPEMCQKCSRCGNLTVLTECSPRSDTVCGITGNSLPKWLVPVVTVLLLRLVFVVLVGLAVYFYCTKRDQLRALWIRCFSSEFGGSPKDHQMSGTALLSTPALRCHLISWMLRMTSATLRKAIVCCPGGTQTLPGTLPSLSCGKFDAPEWGPQLPTNCSDVCKAQ